MTKIKLLAGIAAWAVFASVSAHAGALALEVENTHSGARLGTTNWIDFGTVRVYDSAFRSLRLTNTGDADIADLHMEIRGIDFSGTTNCGHSLAAGAACYVDLEFRPTIAGGASADLYIYADADRLDIYLSGWGSQN